MSENVFKVSSKSSVNALAGAVAGGIRDGKVKLELQAVGAAAVNQALIPRYQPDLYPCFCGCDD
ncbi:MULTISPECIES: stage V sporulation protein S [Paenibacillus]|nr:hypothetical protein POTG_02822 [Paenibacillus sp. oral taxon 786 str. D14]